MWEMGRLGKMGFTSDIGLKSQKNKEKKKSFTVQKKKARGKRWRI